MKAMVRGMIEINGNPAVAYAIDKTDRIGGDVGAR